MSKRLYKQALVTRRYDLNPSAYLAQNGSDLPEKMAVPSISKPSRNVWDIIERSARKDAGEWEKAKDDWYKAYMAGEVSKSEVDALISRLPGKHLRIGSFSASKDAMLAELERLNREGKASINTGDIEIDFLFLQRSTRGRHYLKPGKGEDEFYWVQKEGDSYSIYPPDAKTDHELVLRTIYMLGFPISCKLSNKDINALDRKIASALVDVLSYIIMTGGGESFILTQYATEHQKNAHLKYKCKKQLTFFFVEPRFEGLIPKNVLDYAERVEYS